MKAAGRTTRAARAIDAACPTRCYGTAQRRSHHIGVEFLDRAMRLSVRDDGTGITEAVPRKMFDPFFSTKPPGSGTGLGLFVRHPIMG